MISLRTPCRVAALGVCVSLLVACGSSGGGAAQVATLDTGSVSAATDTTVPVDTEDALLEYAQCMRDNGVEMQDPTVDADGNVQGGFGPDSGIDPRSDDFRTAQEACGDLIEGVAFGGGPGGGRFDQTAIRDGMNSFTECLRDEGLDIDDVSIPQPGQGGPGGTLLDGTYAVEVVESGRTRWVTVEVVGEAGRNVGVTGDGVVEGIEVVVPA